MTNPQDVLNYPGIMIAWFDDLGTGNEEYNFLSNFYEGEPIFIPGWTDPYTGEPVGWKTGEHAFAAMKARRATQRAQIIDQVDPNGAKALGRSCDLRDNWDEVKYDVMAAVIRSKFTLDREEGARLLETGDALLVEGTYWQDDVWGVDLIDDEVGLSSGSNWLGTLLMARRAELKAQKLFYVTYKGLERNAKVGAGALIGAAWMR